MERMNGMKEMEIKISLNKDIILVPKEGTEAVLVLKTNEEEALQYAMLLHSIFTTHKQFIKGSSTSFSEIAGIGHSMREKT